jgi:hypothetical protein
MKTFSRRSVATGLAAAVTAIPVLGFAISPKRDALEQIKHHTRELEKAMRDCYGVEVETLTYKATAEMKPLIMVVAHTL